MGFLGQSLVLKGIVGCNILGRKAEILSYRASPALFPVMMALKKARTTASSSKYISKAPEKPQKEKEILIEIDDIWPGRVLQLRPIPDDDCPYDFCTFIESYPKKQVISFFRHVIHEVEVRRKILDFHLRVTNDPKTRFVIDIFYGVRKDGPEVLAPGSCISCYGDAPLYPNGGVLAGECVLKEFSNQPYVQCSLDAKARPGFIVTPRRHVDRMSELEDEEIYYLWWVCVSALRSQGFNFTRMILNHDCYRNLPHLHLKIWVHPEVHRRARERWTEERRRLWGRLECLANRLHKTVGYEGR